MEENEEMTLRIKTELAPGVGLPAEIAFNYAELKERLAAYCARYDGLVVADGEIAEARRTRAEVNRVIGQLTAAGRETKARWNGPLDAFLARVKELVGIARPVEENLAAQIRAYDDGQRRAKRAALEDYLRTRVRLLAEPNREPLMCADAAEAFVTSPHWAECVSDDMTTASASVVRARKRLADEAARCRAALSEAARVYAGEAPMWTRLACRALAQNGFDTTAAFGEIDRQIAEAKRDEEEQRRRLEAERARAAEAAARAREEEERRLAEPPERTPQGLRPAEQPPERAATAQPAVHAEAAHADDPETTYTLRISGRRSGFFALRRWLVENGMRFERA